MNTHFYYVRQRKRNEFDIEEGRGRKLMGLMVTHEIDMFSSSL